ncbi:general secretion pathway protein GspB [Pseudoalteromonas sp. SCSIO 43201]|uniref:general secretion pathway protein GspB n=1 Tax=Pseudoalteromonas TaxID=53246 RepID=UPI00207630C2|nr:MULTISPECIES: general secretion pathway protein GspB [Pseudoalteromonas]MDW7547402.1 general secretion pathway protein GspB [Pseudoalteromonas peptidolytica]USD27944.1 general secretion pathway protein GspB [Pseudoalteromonas sp. SCSIO 43201]
MSYLTSAMKQSQQGSDVEQDYLNQKQGAQLMLYKRLVTYAGFSLLSLASLGAGYFVGQTTNSANMPENIASSNAQPQTNNMATLSDKPVLAEQAQDSDTIQVNRTEVALDVVADAASAEVAPAPTQVSPSITSDKHFQWVSVQIGVDNQGQPVYQQQLVPVDALTAAPQIVQPKALETVRQDDAPGEIQTEGEYAGYRVFGSEPKAQSADLAGVSEELKKAFAQAVKETELRDEAAVLSTTKESASVTPISLLPTQLQNSIPSLRYQAHIYATDVQERWIKINNRPLYEGDSLGALTVLEITPEQTRFDFDGIEFSLEAMEDWLP